MTHWSEAADGGVSRVDASVVEAQTTPAEWAGIVAALEAEMAPIVALLIGERSTT